MQNYKRVHSTQSHFNPDPSQQSGGAQGNQLHIDLSRDILIYINKYTYYIKPKRRKQKLPITSHPENEPH